MSLTFFWRCEDVNLDASHDFTLGDNTATASGAGISFDAAAARYGTTGILENNNGTYLFDNSSQELANRLTGSFGMWFRCDTGAGVPLTIYVRGASFDDYVALGPSGNWDTNTGDFELHGRSTDTSGIEWNIITTLGDLTVDTWYFVTGSWDQPNSLRRVRVYSDTMTLLQEVEDTSAWIAPLTFASTGNIRIGDNAGPTITQHIDNIFMGSEYADANAFAANATITSYTSYFTPTAATRIPFRGSFGRSRTRYGA